MTTLYTGRLGIVQIGAAVVPGIVKSIEIPERAINWQVQNGAAGLGAATIFRGMKLIESIKIKTLLAIPGRPMTEWDEAVTLWAAFLAAIHPNANAKPPAWDVDHPLFRVLWPPVGRVALKSNAVVPANDLGTAHFGIVELIEYRPLKLAQAGPPDPAKIDNRDKPPADAAEAEMQDLLNKARNL